MQKIMTNEKKLQRLSNMAAQVSIPGRIAVQVGKDVCALFPGKYCVYVDSRKGRTIWHGLSMPKAAHVLDAICTTVSIMEIV